MATGFGPLGDHEVDPAGDRADGMANLAAHAADEDALGVQQVDDLARHAEPGNEQPCAAIDHGLDALLDLSGKCGEQVHAERLVGQLADRCHFPG